MSRMIKILTLLLLSVVGVHAQAAVDISGYPSKVSQPTKLYFYDASGNPTYVCYARSVAPNSTDPKYNFTLTVAATLTNIVVNANVGTITTVNSHGWVQNEKIVITGSATSALNGTYMIQSTPSATTATITTSGVGNATYTDMTITGSLPLTTSAIWSIQKLQYNATNQLQSSQWAGGNPGNYGSICANRAVTTGATAVFYQ